jgi:Tfp pilus assembly protein PilF
VGQNSVLLLMLGGLAAGSGIGCAAGTSNLLTFAEQSRKKGLQQYAAGDYENAAGSFRSATTQDPRDYKSFYYLGASYDKMNNHQQASQAYLSSLKVMDVTLEGKKDTAFRAKSIDGLAISTAKGQDRAVEIAMPQPGKNPAEDAWLRAKIHRYTGDADAAIEAYNIAALQAPNDFYITKDYGLYLETLGQNETAGVQLRKAYRMDSSDQEIALALRRIGMVPGPALKERQELAKPPIPEGPIPPVNEWKMPKFGNSGQATPPAQGAATVQAPRD